MAGGVCGRGACVAGGMHGRGYAWHACPLPDTTSGRGVCMAGACVAGEACMACNEYGIGSRK